MKSKTVSVRVRNGGVVNSQIHQFGSTGAVLSPAKLIAAVELGLPVSDLDILQESLGIPMDKLASKLGISPATLHRRRKAKARLGSEESDRIVRFARLLGKAIAVFGGDEDAKRWLNSPQFGLGGATPLDYCETEIGAREVENLLGRIEYGVYS